MGHYGMGGYGGMGSSGMGFMGGGLFSMLFMIIFWILVAAAAFFFIRWLIETVTAGGAGGPKNRLSAEQDALEIAKQRFARGEITRDEYLEIKQEIS